MAEVKLGPYAPTPGYDVFHVTMEVYRLFSCIAASKSLSRIARTDKANSYVWKELKRAEFSEVCRILIGLAAASRNSLDAGYNSDCETIIVGEWTLNHNKPQAKSKPLTFKEACNKVLHAYAIQPDVIVPKGKTPTMAHPLSQSVYLYGEHRSNEWRAVLDVYAFAATSYGAC